MAVEISAIAPGVKERRWWRPSRIIPATTSQEENADMRFAPSMSRLGTESAFEVLARARALERQGREIIHLEIGEPDFDTPAHIKEAAKQALDAGATHYGPSAGLAEVREAIAKHRSEEHTSELQSRLHLVCRLLLEKKKKHQSTHTSTAIDADEQRTNRPSRPTP